MLFTFAKWEKLWTDHSVVIMYNNTIMINAINSKLIRDSVINSLQFLLLTAAFYDIKIFFTWISFKNNWITDILFYFKIYKIVNKFMQFQITFLSHHEIEKSMSTL